MATNNETTKTCYIDIEGNSDYPVEVGLILVQNNKITCAKVFYGKVFNIFEFKRSQKYCHGMCRKFLDENGYSVEMLRENVFRLLTEDWGPDEIVHNGIDCLWFLAKCNIKGFVLRELTLPEWDIRSKELYHHVAHDLKCGGVAPAKNWSWVFCKVNEAHPFFKIKSKKEVKAVHGAHCSLYDAAELAFCDKPLTMSRFIWPNNDSVVFNIKPPMNVECMSTYKTLS